MPAKHGRNRCLVMKPKILLLDEPMAALDRNLRADVQRELIAIQRAVGTTFILVTHDQEEAMAMSDYIAVMEKGRIAQFGAPRELYERPNSRFVASFLGTINLFEGSAVDVDSGHVRMITPDGLQFLLACAAAIAVVTFLWLIVPSYLLRRWLGPVGTGKQ